MKLIFQTLTTGSEEGFAFKTMRTRQFECPWHFHPEYELILTLHCPGYRMVGDNITPLRRGDLVLIGARLPHIWQHDPHGSAAPVHILLAQFDENFLGESCMKLPAMAAVRQLFRRAAVGLQFTGRTRDRVENLMHAMAHTTGLRRLVLFLTALEAMASSRESRSIASAGFATEINPFNQERMAGLLKYINDHIDEPIRLSEVAKMAHMSEGAFSRFFQRHTARTFPAFVNELRVGRACRLLAETEQSITNISLACGFANLSNFNRQFLRLKRATPSEFRRRLNPSTPPK
jgi:AraC-like DNA-binding protein